METNILKNYVQQAGAENADLREEAARELKTFLPDPIASSCMLNLLGDSDWRVRRAAVEGFLHGRHHQTIPELLSAIYEEENAGKRNAAIDILSGFGKQIVPYLSSHLQSGTHDVKMFLINILGDLRDPTYVSKITEALDYPEPNLVSAAILALGKIGNPESFPHLVRYLEGQDLWLKVQAIEAAGEMLEPAALPYLIQLYASPYCRRAVLRALSRFQHIEAYEALVRFLTVEDQIEAAAVRALYDLYHAIQPAVIQNRNQNSIREVCRKSLTLPQRGILITNYQRAELALKKQILSILSWAQAEEAIPLMIEELLDPEMAEIAYSALLQSKEKAGSFLSQSLDRELPDDTILLILNLLIESSFRKTMPLFERFVHHPNDDIRMLAFRALVESHHQTDPELLIRGALDTNSKIHELCLRKLVDMGSVSENMWKPQWGTLREALQSPVAQCRAHALETLAYLSPGEAEQILPSSLKDESPVVRQKVVGLMGISGIAGFQEALITALTDENPLVRKSAAQSLTSYGTPATADALLRAVQDEDPWVRISVYETLSSRKEARALDVLLSRVSQESMLVKPALLGTLRNRTDIRIKELVIQYLNDADSEVRKEACEVLGNFPDPDVIFHLFSRLQGDSHWSVRVAAIRALTRIGPSRLLEALTERLRVDSDTFVRREILRSLEKLAPDFPPPEIFELLRNPHLMDDAYRFLATNQNRFYSRIKEMISLQPPPVRQILRHLVG